MHTRWAAGLALAWRPKLHRIGRRGTGDSARAHDLSPPPDRKRRRAPTGRNGARVESSTPGATLPVGRPGSPPPRGIRARRFHIGTRPRRTVTSPRSGARALPHGSPGTHAPARGILSVPAPPHDMSGAPFPPRGILITPARPTAGRFLWRRPGMGAVVLLCAGEGLPVGLVSDILWGPGGDFPLGSGGAGGAVHVDGRGVGQMFRTTPRRG
eukprot:scaffold8751_cov98-Isochrysis_galbana.AAC.7